MSEEPFVRFAPQQIDGMEDVTEIVIRPHRLELHLLSQSVTFLFKDFAKSQGWRRPLLVGEREFCTDRRYVRFHTNPPLTIYTPPDINGSYASTWIAQINWILQRGGYATLDLS